MQAYDLPKSLARKAMAEADDELYEKHATGDFDDGDPNNPKYNGRYNYATGKFSDLFGYSQDVFLNKQYA